MKSQTINTNIGQASAGKMKRLSKIKLFSFGIAALAIVATSFAPYSASAATVPNRYECSYWTQLCVQINGAHVNGLPNACRWVWTWYSSGANKNICTTTW